MLASAQSRVPVLDAFDHLLLGVSDLDHGIEWMESHMGIRPAIGGVHPGRGTRNALISLGSHHYLELIAPDPKQPTTAPQFQVSGLAEPRLIKFAVTTNDMAKTAASLRGAGVRTVGPRDGSRRTASGALLRWKALEVESDFQSGGIDPVPFFIEWASDSVHPSRSAPTGCAIEDLQFKHPRASELKAKLRVMGLDTNVAQADEVRIIAVVQTLKGRVQLS